MTEQRQHPDGHHAERYDGGRSALLRTAIGVGMVVPAAAEGLLVGVLRRDRRAGVDHFIERWLDTLFLSCGVTLDVEGRQHLWEQRPAVFLFNHKNNFDILVAAKVVGGKFTSVGKKEAADNPLGAVLGNLVDAVFIDRSDSQSAVDALKPVEEAIDKGLSLIISPEGTRSTDRRGPAVQEGPVPDRHGDRGPGGADRDPQRRRPRPTLRDGDARGRCRREGAAADLDVRLDARSNSMSASPKSASSSSTRSPAGVDQ